MAMAGINRLLSMQTPSGGFGYWPGHTEPTDWGTANVIHILLDAEKAGFPVPKDRLARALAFAEQQVRNFERQRPSYQADWKYPYDPEPYLHFVLAMAGRG